MISAGEIKETAENISVKAESNAEQMFQILDSFQDIIKVISVVLTGTSTDIDKNVAKALQDATASVKKASGDLKSVADIVRNYANERV